MSFFRNLFKRKKDVFELHIDFLNIITGIIQQSIYGSALEKNMINLYACSYIITDSILSSRVDTLRFREQFFDDILDWYLCKLYSDEYKVQYAFCKKTEEDGIDTRTLQQKMSAKFKQETTEKFHCLCEFYSEFISGDKKPRWDCYIFVQPELLVGLLPQYNCFVAFCDILANPECQNDYDNAEFLAKRVKGTLGFLTETLMPAFQEINQHIHNVLP